jgi:hypothetical protein
MRIAWFSPLSSLSKSRSAYATYHILDHFPSDLKIDLYSDTTKPFLSAGKGRKWPVAHYLTAVLNHKRSPYDLFLYQIEDGMDARWVRHIMPAYPGIVWFHEILFTTPLAPAVAVSPWCATLRTLQDPVRHPWISDKEWQKKDNSVPSFDERWYRGDFDSPFGKREFSFAAIPVFSQSWQNREFRRLRDEAREPFVSQDLIKNGFNDSCSADNNGDILNGTIIPLPLPQKIAEGVYRPVFYQDEESQQKKSEAGRGYINRTRAVMLAWCGTPSVESRSFKILAALREVSTKQISHQIRLVWLIDVSETDRAQELVHEASVTELVELIPNRSPDTWCDLVASAHAAIHLHYSVYSSLEPYLSLSLAQGVPVMVSDFAEGEIVSDSLALKIAPGPGELAQIIKAMVALSNSFGLDSWRHGMEMGSSLRPRLHPHRVAGELMILFERAQAKLPEWIKAKWEPLMSSARQEVLRGVLERYSKDESIFVHSVPTTQEPRVQGHSSGDFERFILEPFRASLAEFFEEK